jgi:hypothetical protein
MRARPEAPIGAVPERQGAAAIEAASQFTAMDSPRPRAGLGPHPKPAAHAGASGLHLIAFGGRCESAGRRRARSQPGSRDAADRTRDSGPLLHLTSTGHARLRAICNRALSRRLPDHLLEDPAARRESGGPVLGQSNRPRGNLACRGESSPWCGRARRPPAAPR